ncbi:MAG: O-antigen ligase family protein [Mucilaginibacter sp.]
MKQLLPADSLANRISFYHLLLLLASLPFNLFYSHLILISFSVHVVIQLNRRHFRSVFRWRTLLLQSVFIVTLISSLYSINKPQAVNQISLQLPILLIPVVFPLSGFDFKKYRQPLLMGFSVICTLTVLYLFWDAFRTIRFYNLPFSELFSSAFTNHNFAEPIDMHATFFSMQLAIALVYLLTVMVGKNVNRLKIVSGICIAVLIAGLFQLCSKSALFSLFISVCIAFPLFMFKGKQRIKYWLALWSLALIAGVSVFKVKAFKERFFNELKADLSKPVAGESVEPRRARWNIAFELIKVSPVIGHGAGSETGLLHEAFYQKKYYNSFLNNLNAHNQYLSFLLQSGILGLIVYLFTLVYGFRLAFSNRDLLFFTYMVLLAVVSLSEDYLAVDKGVFFYAVFFSFFILSNHKKHSKQTVKQQDKFITEGNLVNV